MKQLDISYIYDKFCEQDKAKKELYIKEYKLPII